MSPEDRSLLLDYLSDDLTEEEFGRLVVRLKQDERLAANLLDLAGDEARLVEWARSIAAGDGAPTFGSSSSRNGSGSGIAGATAGLGGARSASVAAPVSTELSTEGRSQPGPQTTRTSRAGAWLLAATPWIAAAIAAVWTGVAAMREDTPAPVAATVPPSTLADPQQSLVARVVNESSDSDWYTERLSHQDPWSLHRGDVLRLNAGSLRIRYDHGTSMTLQAPAVLELQDDMHARIHRGALRVVVAQGAEGFSVATPIARVVDLGTEFGVSVDDRGGTDVVVYEGAVDIEGRANEVGPPRLARRLEAGQAVRMDELGTASRIVAVNADRFPVGAGESLETVRGMRPPIIAKVTDNIDREDSFSFYEIVHAGMFEDALAFVDRPEHEWNGVDAKGMPEYLIGGDLVRTFNDDKLNKQLRIELELTQPADIYVLLDDRAQAPEWLKRGFERLDDRLGIDEGSGKYRDLAPDGSVRWEQRPTGSGPGASIDFTCSIWRRVAEAGPVGLGPLGGDNWDINMYGIVAVPQEAKADEIPENPLAESGP
ncbi:FecR family protein [Botrimarina sp.]|uniref:FecR family protein n=1 Tax=Botrimarina sp. TaxID=2795802 RepID=UPI0032EFDEB3